jgi:hypothetical protein
MLDRPRDHWQAVREVLGVALAIGILAAAYAWGWTLRESIWTGTADIRFHGDIENARNQSRNVLLLAARRAGVVPERIGTLSIGQVFDGYEATYETQWDTAELRLQRRVARGRASREIEPRPELDYPPLRLAVMTLWNWNNARGDRPIDVDYADAPVQPLLDFNAAMTVLAAGAAFLLAYDVRRSALLSALVASSVWLSPAILLNTHAWPQWDVWVLPGLLWSAYFAKSGRWALAGATIAFFAMFKGQVLLAATPIAVWSLFAQTAPSPGVWVHVGKRFAAPVRLICGLLAGAAGVLWVWLVRDNAAWTWPIACGGLATALMLWPHSRSRDIATAQGFRALWWCLAAISLFTLVLPTLHAGWLPMTIALAWGAVVLPLASLYLRRGRSGIVFGTAGLTVLLLGLAYGGSWAFIHVGFPTTRYAAMAMGPNYNLPAILQGLWGWNINDAVATGWTIRDGARVLTLGLLVLSGIAMAVHARRDDPRFLAAVALPMLVVYSLMPQMHERYLMYPAGMASLLLALSVGGWITWAALTALSASLMLHCMINANGGPGRWSEWLRTIEPLAPAAGFTVLAVLVMVMYLAFTPTPRLRWEQPV